MKIILPILSVVAAFCFSEPVFGQAISLRVVAAQSGESLPLATVSLNNGTAFYADENGYFSLVRHDATDSLSVTYVGYRAKKLAIATFSPTQLNLITLTPELDLPTVEVTTPRAIFNRSLSVLSPDLIALERVPLIVGESDPLKALQLLPGISGATEGSAGISIRGGNVSQTHLLIDGNAIYNANHIGGFLSSLPSFGIKRIDVYKGGVPAYFGGRLSGVVDVQLRDGRRDGPLSELVVGTGLIRAGTEGPIGKKWSYLINGRIAYPNLVDRLINSSRFEKKRNGSFETFSLGDAVGKLTYHGDHLSTTTSVFASGDNGFGQDDFQLNRFFFDEFSWSTLSVSQQFRYAVKPALLLRGGIQYSRYAYRYDNVERLLANDVESENGGNIEATLSDPGANLRLSYQAGQNLLLTAGIQLTNHHFTHRQGSFDELTGPRIDTLQLSQQSTQVGSFLHLRADLLNRRLQIDAGLRDSRLVGTNFHYLEPRLRIGYHFGPGLSLNAGFDDQTQYVHQIAADVTVFPNDLWLIASPTFRPARSRQFFLGAATSLSRWELEISVEAFTKQLTGLTEANPLMANAQTEPTQFLNNLVSNGEGRARGIELYVEKRSKRITSSLAYTLSSSDRRFADLNDGKWYPFTFDRRHDFALNLGYQLPRNWFFTSTFVYQTGRAITLPVLTSPLLNIFSTINNGRFSAFHRLNLAFEKQWVGRKRKSTRHTLSLSIYNAYNQDNPFEVFFFPDSNTEQDPDTGEFVTRTTVEIGTRQLFPIIPGISYKRTFR